MKREVFLSLLALDSYNRGYGQNVELDARVRPANLGNINSRIGDALVASQSNITAGSVAREAGFYAIAYDWNGETVISYRGTNFDTGDSIVDFFDSPLVQDIWNGWTLGAGFQAGAGLEPGSQAGLSIAFYKAVSGRSVFDPVTSEPTATLVGHSLGGGLAGFVASLSNEDAVGFDHMPFGVGAIFAATSEAVRRAMQQLGVTHYEAEEFLERVEEGDLQEIEDGILTKEQVEDAIQDNFSDLNPTRSALTGYFAEGEVLVDVRNGELIELLGSVLGRISNTLTSIPAVRILGRVLGKVVGSTIGNIVDGELEDLAKATAEFEEEVDKFEVSIRGSTFADGIIGSAIDQPLAAHSMSLLTLLLFAEKQWTTESDDNTSRWERGVKYILPTLITDDGLARGAFTIETGLTGAAAPSDQLAAMVAYSVLRADSSPSSEFQLIYGDTGARALLDDAQDLGTQTENRPKAFTEETLFSIGEIAAEFAGLLAYNRIEAKDFEDATDGILNAGGNSLAIDTSSETWSQYDQVDQIYKPRKTGQFINQLFDERLGADDDSDASRQLLRERFDTWLLGPATNPIRLTPLQGVADLVDRVVFTFSNSSSGGVLTGEADPEGIDGYQLFIGQDNDISDGNSAGYRNNLGTQQAIIISGNGTNDLVGTDGNDAFITGTGNDKLVGGAGNDFFAPGRGEFVIYGDNEDRSGSGVDRVLFTDALGTITLTYEQEKLNVNGSQTSGDLYDVEEVEFDTGEVSIFVKDNIAEGTQLNISVAEGGTQLIHAVRSRAAVKISLDPLGNFIEDKDTGGRIGVSGFNTTIFGSEYADTITDLSDEEKTIVGGDGDDTISIAETDPDSVLIGGAGADQIIGGHGDDVIIDQQSDLERTVELSDPSAPIKTFDQGGIIGGFGDDQIVIDIAGAPTANGARSTDGFFQLYSLDPGEGNDSIEVDFAGGVRYIYNRGDGADIVETDNFVDFSNFDPIIGGYPSIILDQTGFVFDFDDYSRDEVTVKFGLESQDLIGIDVPNLDVPVLLNNGNLLIEFSDGGSIFIEDIYAISGSYLQETLVLDFSASFATETLGGRLVAEIVMGEITAPPAPPSPAPPAPEVSAQGGSGGNPPLSPDGRASPSIGNEPRTSQSSPDASPSQANPSAQNASGGDQEVRLERGVANYIGGAGLDRLIVEWTLDTLVVTGDASNFTISDRWGVLGTTTLTDFDEIQVFETDTIFTVQGFLDAVEARQFSAPIAGTEEDDTLLGTDVRDRIGGLEGNDTIDGLAGDDILTGGAGDDIIDGSAGEDELFGNEGQDTLRGGVGDDLLDGGAGDDTLEGGLGDDTYVVDSASDTITEAADAGIDRVEAAIDYTLSENIEELTLTGSAISGTGNAGDNRIEGNQDNNTLTGLGGNDILLGRDGDDTLNGGEGADILQGNDGADVLFGGADDDRLDGGAGDDELIGGLGDDTYVIDSSGDAVIEAAGEGFDTVISNAISYTADANIEEVVLGDEALDASASDEGIIIKGNALNNAISGGEGEDELYGGAGDDFLTGSGGGSGSPLPPGGGGGTPLTPLTGIGIGIGDPPPDPEPSADGNDRIFGEDGDDVIFGGLGDDDIYGGSGNDKILGEDGRDNIFGGLGFDLIFAQSDGDLIVGEGEASREDVGRFVSAPGWSAESGQTDVVSYSGARSDFEITALGNGWFEVQSLLPDAGDADLLVRIGEIEFVSDAGVELFSLTPPEAALGFEQVELTQGDSFAVTLDSSWFVDPNGETFQFTLTQADGSVPPAWVSLDNGQITGTSPTDFDGTISLVVTATSTTGSASRTLEIAVGTDNDAPQLNQGLADIAFAEDSTIEFEVPSDAFVDPDGDALSLTATLPDGSPLPDWLSFDGTAFTGTPPQNFNGALELTVTASDGSLEVADSFTLTIDPVADAPEAVADSFVTEEDTALQITAAELIGNDTDVDSTALSLVALQNAIGGVVSLENGVVTFTPNTDFFGTASFEYLVTDGDTDPVVGTVSIEVTPINDAVRTGSDSFDTDEDVAINLAPADFLSNDIDPEGGAVSITSVTALTAGANAVIEADGSITLTPPADAFGLIRFEYVVTDDEGLESSGQVSLFATSVNDAPVLVNELADQSSPEEASFSFAIDPAAFSDVDDSMLTLSATLGDGSPLPEWMAFDGVSLTGTPPQHFNGSLEITVTASDGEFSASDTFTLTIDPVNDAPMLLQVLPDVSSPEDTAFSFGIPDGSFVDVDGDTLTLSATLDDGSAIPDWLSFDGETFAGTPPQDFNGSLALTVTASDGELSASDTFTLTIDPVNDAPVLVRALSDVSSAEDEAVSVLLPQDIFADVDGDALTVTATLVDGSDLPEWLNFDGSEFTGTPPQNFNGALGLLVTASDGELTADAAFTLTIDPVNDAPVLVQALADVSSDEDAALSVALPS
ncbi:tandem-95 repeat protein, partial [uncultured Erythrobacter sp.]|uniref:tandem-95 repeat protein n=1 Tax=uncultured Erythrobacter sp. TaxID=263913 RepID=UPI0026118345